MSADRALVVRVGRIGDVVMVTPALRMLLDGRPHTEVHVLTSAEGRRVLRGFDPRLAAFHLYSRRFFESLLARRRVVRELEAAGFSRVYLFETHSHYAKLLSGLALMTHRFDVPPRSAHYAARCLDVVEPTLERAVARGGLSLPVTEAGRADAAAYLAAHGVAPADVLVGLHLSFSETGRGALASGRGRKHREWSVDRCVELARRLHAHGRTTGMPIRPVLDVLPSERPMAEAVRERAGGTVTVLSGAPDFERYKALLARMRLFVTPNTGPMHVAAAVGTPVVALFSGWSPEDCGPFVAPGRATVLRAEDTAAPARGLAAITVDDVFAACRGHVGG